MYSRKEEAINIYSHMFGILLGIVALVLLIMKAANSGSYIKGTSYIVYALSIIALYSASTIYHSTVDEKKRHKMKIIDHCAIFLLIAGSYTPYALAVMGGSSGYLLACVTWSIAVVGIILKLFFTGRFNVLSTLMYVMMGWVVVFFIKPLMMSISDLGLQWLIIGGVVYTTGAVFYSIEKVPYNHAIFHMFVLLGSFSHFVSIYFYT
jgi:hemolysin III